MEDDYAKASLQDSVHPVVILNDRSAETNIFHKNREVMKGHYEFKFPEHAVTLGEKLTRLASEPTAYHLYKRGDIKSKIDKFATENIAMANTVYNLTR